MSKKSKVHKICYMERYRRWSCSYVFVLLFWLWLDDYRLRAAGKPSADGAKKTRTRDRAARAVPAPGANAELQANLDVCPDKLFSKKLYNLSFIIIVYFWYTVSLDMQQYHIDV